MNDRDVILIVFVLWVIVLQLSLVAYQLNRIASALEEKKSK